MALFDRETDPAKERDGVPLDFGEFRVTLRRAGGENHAYELELDKAFRPYRATMKHGKMSKATERSLIFEVFARTCVVKWETRLDSMALPPTDPPSWAVVDGPWIRGIDMRGDLVQDTERALVALFEALPGIYVDIQAAARGEDLFRVEQREDAAGN